MFIKRLAGALWVLGHVGKSSTGFSLLEAFDGGKIPRLLVENAYSDDFSIVGCVFRALFRACLLTCLERLFMFLECYLEQAKVGGSSTPCTGRAQLDAVSALLCLKNCLPVNFSRLLLGSVHLRRCSSTITDTCIRLSRAIRIFMPHQCPERLSKRQP